MSLVLNIIFIASLVIKCYSVFFTGKGTPINTALIYGPLNTSSLSNAKVFFDEKDDRLCDLPNEVLLIFKAQFPAVEAFSTHGKFKTVSVIMLAE